MMTSAALIAFLQIALALVLLYLVALLFHVVNSLGAPHVGLQRTPATKRARLPE